MARSGSGKNLVFLYSCAGLLGGLLIVDIFWSSSSSISSAYRSLSSNWALQKSGTIIFPNATAKDDHHKSKGLRGKIEREAGADRLLPATFGDLAAPELEWEKMESAPVPRLDGYSVQIKNLLYVFVGYGDINHVHSHVDIYNFSENRWGERLDTPKEMAHSHLGVATDGRYIYIVSGQYGPQCRTSIALTFSLDTVTKKWSSMPPLPVPRYAPATQLWRGRLHVTGGSKENRHTPALEHWSIAVLNGQALESHWRSEVPIPRGGPHRACIVVNDKLLVIGGQEGDFMPKPGSPIFKCSRRNEVVYGDMYMLDSEMEWKALPSMPKPDSHIECAWVILNNSIIITGGTTEKHPVTKRMILVGEVFQFHLDMVSDREASLPHKNYTSWFLEWMAVFHIWTAGQRTR